MLAARGMSIIDRISREELLIAGYVSIVAVSLLGLLLVLIRRSRRDEQRLDEGSLSGPPCTSGR